MKILRIAYVEVSIDDLDTIDANMELRGFYSEWSDNLDELEVEVERERIDRFKKVLSNYLTKKEIEELYVKNIDYIKFYV